MTNATTTAEAEAYLEAVRRSLDDLPADERAELLEDLELHLAEVSAGDEMEGRSLTALLGAPDLYAAELRAAAGLPPRPASGPDPDSADGLWSAIADRAARSGAGRLAAAVWRHPATVESRAFAVQLQPAWWVLRGYLVVALPAWWQADASDDFPIPSVLGSQVIGAAVVAAAVVLSVRVGRGATRLPLVRPAVVNAAIVVAVFALLPHTDSRLLRPMYVSASESYRPAGLSSDYGLVTNVYPYGADGKPLEGVLLFDQDGRPLRVADQEWWPDGCYRIADHPKAIDGVQVDFAYPRRYVVASRDVAPHRAPDARQCIPGVPTRPPMPLPTFPAEVPPPAG